MKNRFLLKFITITLISLWGYAFIHLVHMGTMHISKECAHAQNSHELCKMILDIQVTEKIHQKEISLFLLFVIPVLLTTLLLVKYIQVVTKIHQNNKPSLFQELFSNGILNPKAP